MSRNYVKLLLALCVVAAAAIALFGGGSTSPARAQTGDEIVQRMTITPSGGQSRTFAVKAFALRTLEAATAEDKPSWVLRFRKATNVATAPLMKAALSDRKLESAKLEVFKNNNLFITYTLQEVDVVRS